MRPSTESFSRLFSSSSSTSSSSSSSNSASSYSTSWPFSKSPVNQPDRKYGATPLYYACQRGNLREVRRLLRSFQANVNSIALCSGGARMMVDDAKVPSAMYRAPLHIACARGHLEVVRELLAHPRVDVNLLVNNFTPLHAAIANGQLEVIKELLGHARINVNEQDLNGDTSLNLCCKLGAVKALQALCLHPDTDFNLVNDEGRAPFVQALAYGEIEAATALLHHLQD